MYTCSHCEERFSSTPFIGSNNKKYCSRNCIPDSVMDQLYSFQYFLLIDNIKAIEESIDTINTLEVRMCLENEVRDLSTSYSVDMWGDDEDLFYKNQIIKTLPFLDELYDRIHNVFNQKEYAKAPAVIIHWEDLRNIVGENAAFIYDDFKPKAKAFGFENVYLPLGNRISRDLYFDHWEDRLKMETMSEAENIKNLFMESVYRFSNVLTELKLEELENYSYCVETTTLYFCVVCEQWEPWECFTYYDNLKAYKCDEHCSCFDCKIEY